MATMDNDSSAHYERVASDDKYHGYLVELFPEWSKGVRLHRWTVFKTVKQMVMSEKKLPSLNRVSGPGVVWAAAGFLSLFYFFTAIPIIYFYTCDCPDSGEITPFAVAPEAVLWAVFFLPAAGIVLVCQHVCMRYVLTPILGSIKNNLTNDKGEKEGFDILGLPCQFPFNWWYGTMCVLTLLNLLDNMTNAVWTARLVVTARLGEVYKCTMFNEVQEAWYETWTQSGVFGGLVRWLGSDYFKFSTVAIIAYSAQLIGQVFGVVYFSCPIPCYNERFPSFDLIEAKDSEQEQAEFTTLSDDRGIDDKTDYRTSLLVLAEASRMEALTSQDMKYRLAEVSKAEKKAREGNEEEVSKAHDELCELTLTGITRGVLRFALKGLLQNAIQVNLQSSLLGVGKAIKHIGVDWGNTFSVWLTVVGMLADIPDMCTMAMFFYRMRGKLEGISDKRIDQKVKLIRKRHRLLMIWMLLYVLMALYAALKLWFVYYCPNGTGNLNGCSTLNLHKVRNGTDY